MDLKSFQQIRQNKRPNVAPGPAPTQYLRVSIPLQYKNRKEFFSVHKFQVEELSQKLPEIDIHEDRKYACNFFAPFESRETQIQKVGDRAWVLTQPFLDVVDKQNGVIGDTIVKLKMVVYQFKDGSIFVHNPIAPTQECIKLIQHYIQGEIRHVVSGGVTPEHTYFIQEFCQKMCPEATVWITPNVQDQINTGKNPQFNQLLKNQQIQTLSNKQTWCNNNNKKNEIENENEIEVKLVHGNGDFGEAQFLLKDEKILLTTDYTVGVKGEEKIDAVFEFMIGGKKADVLLPTFGCNASWQNVMMGWTLEPRQKLIDFYVDVCQWDFEHVVPAHGDIFMGNGKQEYLRMVREYFGEHLV